MVIRVSTIGRVVGMAILAGCMVLPGVSWADDDDDKKGKKVSNKQLKALILMLKDQVDMVKDQLDNVSVSVDLRGVTQNWDKKLDSTNGEANGCNSDRFTCLWPDGDGQPTAVRDNETGLVWEQSPDPNPQANWQEAIRHCAGREVAGRKGWSLPMREQLASLVDTTSQSCTNDNICLPDGHPFDPAGVQSAFYWSASSDALLPTNAWFVLVVSGNVRTSNKGNGILHAWCVRGGQVYDGQDVLQTP